MKTQIAFDLCLLALAVVVSIMAITMALRGGWEISRPNFYYALCWGLLGYAGCFLGLE